MEEITLSVDAATAAEIRRLKGEVGKLTRHVEERDRKIEELEKRVDGWAKMQDALQTVYDVWKYDLGLDDGNERC